MALILSLETSATTCSVALHKDGLLVNTLQITESQAHASKLATLIRDISGDSSGTLPEIDAVAVSSGPGSYTGLRIGTSTAKGICYARNIPLISINTLDLLTAQFLQNNSQLNGLLCPMIDARRMEVYCQIQDQNGKLIRNVEAVVIDQSGFSELLKDNKMFFFGDGAGKCKEVLIHENALIVDGYVPEAQGLGKLAFGKFRKNEWEELATFVPFYVKDFMAKKASPVF
jgi:tRNA threonylcarbamoyladenosine biosynthesis protein TsaB